MLINLMLLLQSMIHLLIMPLSITIVLLSDIGAWLKGCFDILNDRVGARSPGLLSIIGGTYE
jgi:hypothetical protein